MTAKSFAKQLPFVNRRAHLRLQKSERRSYALTEKSVVFGSYENDPANISLLNARSIHNSMTLGKKTDPVFDQMLSTKNKTIEISKLIGFREANLAGTMHGGDIMALLEEAGMISATQHIYSHRDPSLPPCVPYLVRAEKVDFRLPIELGDMVEVDSEVTFASEHSCEVCVTVEKRSVRANYMELKLAITAYLWFVPVYYDKKGQRNTVEMPPFLNLTPEEQAAGQARYEAQLACRADLPAHLELPELIPRPQSKLPKRTVRHSQVLTSHMANVAQCDIFRMMRGGALMKMADEAGATSATLHTEGVGVTAMVDGFNFRNPIPAGSFIFLFAYLTFTSDRTIEVEVVGHHGTLNSRSMKLDMHPHSFDALFTFIPFDHKGRPKPPEPLILENDAEKKEFEKGRKRHELQMKRVGK